MQDELILLGKFKGSFFTGQMNSLGKGDPFPLDNLHALHVFKGELKEGVIEKKHKPQKYKKHGSCTLLNVSNVMVYPTNDGIVTKQRPYVFTHLLLIEPKVNKTYLLNNKTYGEIESLAYGITQKLQKVKPNGPTPIGPGGGGGGESGGGGDDSGGGGALPGGMRLPDGCFGSVWRILKYLLLILLLIGLIRGCNCQSDYCAEKDRLKLILEEENRRLDSTKVAYEENLEKALSSVSIVYFYRNTNEIHINSKGNNSPIERLHLIIETYDDRDFIIDGYNSGAAIESQPNLDLMRAEALKIELIKMGIPSSRLTTAGKGDSVKLDNTDRLSTYFISPGNVKEYNRNMRAQARYVKIK